MRPLIESQDNHEKFEAVKRKHVHEFEVLSPTDCQDSSISQTLSRADTGAGEDQKICMPGKCRGVERNPSTWFQIQKLPAIESGTKLIDPHSLLNTIIHCGRQNGKTWLSKYLFNFQNKVQHAQMLDTPEYTKKQGQKPIGAVEG